MAAKYCRFVLIKLILVIFAAVAACLTSVMTSAGMNDGIDATVRTVFTSVIPAAVFFAFIFSFEAKIRRPDELPTARYFVSFTLRETSVYAIFLLFPTISAGAGAAPAGTGALASAIRPHLPFVMFGMPVVLNYIAMCALFAALAFAAHLRTVKKTVPVPVAVEADAEPDVNADAGGADGDINDASEGDETDDEN